MLKYISEALLPTEYGKFTIYGFRDINENQEIVVLKSHTWSWDNILMRIHSKCLTGDVFHSLRCDCHVQLDYALQKIGNEGGLLVYLDQEGRGIWILNKIKAYKLQEEWFDTVEANEQLGLPVDDRNYDALKDILDYFNIHSVKLLTNNPLKVKALADAWIDVQREQIVLPEHEHSKKYLQTKKEKMSHLL